MTLCNGGTLVVIPKHLRGDLIALAKLIAAEAVTWTQATPSEYISWIQHGHESLKNSSWKFACAGGERVTLALMECFRSFDNKTWYFVTLMAQPRSLFLVTPV